MAEGGQLPWKVQKIDTSRGPPGDYKSISKPLPDPPKDTEWKCNEKTREWYLAQISASDGRHEYNEAGVVMDSSEDTCQTDGHRLTSRDKPLRKPKLEGRIIPKNPYDAPDNSDETVSAKGMDYIEHTVLPTDTLPGICLTYKISATKLRQANRFSGSNLLFAPPKLVIPLKHVNGPIKVQDTNSSQFKLHALRAEFPSLSMPEARAYLDLAPNGDVQAAISAAREDFDWEASTLRPVGTTDLILDAYVAVPANPPVQQSVGAQNNNPQAVLEMTPMTCDKSS